MNCFFHQEITATAQCQICKRGLCNQCIEKANGTICIYCTDQIQYMQLKRARKIAALSFIFAVLGGVYSYSSNYYYPAEMHIITVILFSFLCAGIPHGWAFLNDKLSGNCFLSLPIVGWIIFFFIKYIFSAFCGWLILIFKIIRKVAQKTIRNPQR